MKHINLYLKLLIVMILASCIVMQPVFAGSPGTRPADNVMMLLSSPYPVTPHSIVPEVTEVGKISTSINAIGENSGSGTLTIVKPAGATVRKAYMAAATTGFSSYTLAAGDIKIDGTPVTWDIADFPNSIESFNYFTDVTSIVKSKIDSAPAGDVSFDVSEQNTTDIDGEILAVIFDDPSQTTDNTVVLLFGAQQTTGDTFNIGLAKPIDKTDPNLGLDFSLGISFGFQPSGQFSWVNVSGQRLTTSAGGQDDGQDEDGALITVGGVGDSNANPADPYQDDSFGPRYDDELYSLLPFVANGDTSIKVETLNPSNDDNIFFAALNLKSATAVVGEGITLSPVSATNNLGETHTLTAKIQDSQGNPIAGKTVTFTITSGPNAGMTGTAVTNAQGEATFSYTSSLTGTDTIVASFMDDTGKPIQSNEATKVWQKGGTPIPEFPITLIPVAGLFGMILVVYSIRKKYS